MMLGVSWKRSGSYRNRMRCLIMYLATITSWLERRFNLRLPTMTCHAYFPWLRAFSMPVVAPVCDLISIALHPHDWVSPVLRFCNRTDTSLPQSHRHIQWVLGFLDSSKYSAVSLPNFLPVTSSLRLTFCLHPQEAFGLLSSNPVSLVTTLPQMHRHTQANPPRLFLVRLTTVKYPNCIPTKLSEPNRVSRASRLFSVNLSNDARRKQPHETVLPLFRLTHSTNFSLPQSQRQSQTAPRAVLCEYESTVNFPNFLPVKSTILLRPVPIVGVPTGIPIAPSNNNARHAAHVKLPRPHIRRDGRSYQYSTRACGLGNQKYITEGAI